MAYKINENFFDNIDSENKAYWMGFIWCDGYSNKRMRKNGRVELAFKLSLQESDKSHLEKFAKDLESSCKIRIYELKNSFENCQNEARLLIGNQYFSNVLQNEYGLIPHRIDCSKVCDKIPKIFYKDFIRGILDADGSFSKYTINNGRHNKYSVDFSTYQNLLWWILDVLYESGIVENKDRKLYRRNKERDGECRSLRFSGKTQGMNVLNYLYKDSKIYLDRKYEKYLKIRNEAGYEI